MGQNIIAYACETFDQKQLYESSSADVPLYFDKTCTNRLSATLYKYQCKADGCIFNTFTKDVSNDCPRSKDEEDKKPRKCTAF